MESKFICRIVSDEGINAEYEINGNSLTDATLNFIDFLSSNRKRIEDEIKSCNKDFVYFELVGFNIAMDNEEFVINRLDLI